MTIATDDKFSFTSLLHQPISVPLPQSFPTHVYLLKSELYPFCSFCKKKTLIISHILMERSKFKSIFNCHSQGTTVGWGNTASGTCSWMGWFSPWNLNGAVHFLKPVHSHQSTRMTTPVFGKHFSYFHIHTWESHQVILKQKEHALKGWKWLGARII